MVAPILGRIGKRSGRATSTATANPISCFKTRTARSRSGKWTGPTRSPAAVNGSASILGRVGKRSGRATSTATAIPISCFRTRTARLRSGKWTEPTRSAAAVDVGANPGPSWKVVGTGDFNGDGKSDILLQNTDGQAAIWEMNGTDTIAGGSQWVGRQSWAGLASGRDGRLQWRRQIRYPVSKHGGSGGDLGNGREPTQIAGGSQWVGPNPGPSWLAIKA